MGKMEIAQTHKKCEEEEERRKNKRERKKEKETLKARTT